MRKCTVRSHKHISSITNRKWQLHVSHEFWMEKMHKRPAYSGFLSASLALLLRMHVSALRLALGTGFRCAHNTININMEYDFTLHFDAWFGWWVHTSGQTYGGFTLTAAKKEGEWVFDTPVGAALVVHGQVWPRENSCESCVSIYFCIARRHSLLKCCT